MLRAIRHEEVKSVYAAARKGAETLPGNPAANERRLYRKFRERKAELEAEPNEEEDGEDEVLNDSTMTVVLDLLSKPLEIREARLTRLFRAAALGEALQKAVVENLRAEGLELSEDLHKKLGRIVYYLRLLEQEHGSDAREAKHLKQKKKERAETSKKAEPFPVKVEQKRPDSGG
jgi:hypothetical protein